jgi:hypothetical protein
MYSFGRGAAVRNSQQLEEGAIPRDQTDCEKGILVFGQFIGLQQKTFAGASSRRIQSM